MTAPFQWAVALRDARVFHSDGIVATGRTFDPILNSAHGVVLAPRWLADVRAGPTTAAAAAGADSRMQGDAARRF
ncbi:hypothetical protein [Mycobacterium hubeiense]|uniref:hypothetical protein n=1 Tax=Mycobacterium hubeiense TaxID=1867256 RepID=UPI000C7F360D|nr:hypothetical protein [Mycobacterium sp. QGD 101]